MQSKNKPIASQPVLTTYTSKDVSIPDNFLTTFPADSKPITVHAINFSSTVLPEYHGCYAVVLENVLSSSECLELLSLAEQSVIDPISETDAWKPAMVNVGMGYELWKPDYRNSDRIIWDNKVITDRLLERCFLGEGIKEQLSKIERNVNLQGSWGVESGEKWRVTRLNERMRFLRYGTGQFFKPHTDGVYEDPVTKERTFYTFHFYLNDSKEAVPGDDDVQLVGGATSFLSNDISRPDVVDVDCKIGRVLIFQHKRLRHAGADVIAGLKYTMRSDLMFERVHE